MFRALWLTVISAMSVNSAYAEEVQQTPEGAQKFLSLVFEQQDVRFGAYIHAWPAAVNWQASVAQAAGDCSTRIEGTVRSYTDRSWDDWHRLGEARFNAEKGKAIAVKYNLGQLPYMIDWTRVTSLSLVDGLQDKDMDIGPGTVVHIHSGLAYGRFLFPDAALARRVHYAMTFLKEHCDKTAETGF